jgi:dTDP-4-dehydrorhamnose reductase
VTDILVTGGTGQLATALGRAAVAATLGQVRVVGRPELDFDRPGTIDALFAATPPSVLVNAAAWTAVDAAETEPDAARRANTDGPARLAALCRRHGTRLIHISTDYVFDGAKGAPYTETDPTSPTGIYGTTKRDGERAVLAEAPDAVILRTAWVYAETGRNFVRTMLNAARKTSHLRVVSDQHGNPTNADDLAQAVLAVAASLGRGAPGGVYHAAGAGEATWHSFALAIFAEAAAFGCPVPEVAPIATADWPTPARRPADSRLDCGALYATHGVRLPEWRPSLRRAVAAICATMASA